jgi:hypothetical protein
MPPMPPQGGPQAMPMPGGGAPPEGDAALMQAIIQMLMQKEGGGQGGMPSPDMMAGGGMPMPPQDPSMPPGGGPPMPPMPPQGDVPMGPGGEGMQLTPEMIEMLLASGPGNAVAPMPEQGAPGLMNALASRGRGGPR